MSGGGRWQAENDESVIEQWDKKRVKWKVRKHGHVESSDARVDWFSSRTQYLLGFSVLEQISGPLAANCCITITRESLTLPLCHSCPANSGVL